MTADQVAAAMKNLYPSGVNRRCSRRGTASRLPEPEGAGIGAITWGNNYVIMLPNSVNKPTVKWCQQWQIQDGNNWGDNVFDGIPVGQEEASLFEQFLSDQDFAANTREAYSQDVRKFASWFAAANQEAFPSSESRPGT